MSNNKYCMTMVSVATKEQASTISKYLVANRLATCVQITKINSVYVWDGECQEDDEFLLLIKTEKSKFPEIEEAVQRLHDYDVPEIICLDITDGSHDYLAWITETVA